MLLYNILRRVAVVSVLFALPAGPTAANAPQRRSQDSPSVRSGRHSDGFAAVRPAGRSHRSTAAQPAVSNSRAAAGECGRCDVGGCISTSYFTLRLVFHSALAIVNDDDTWQISVLCFVGDSIRHGLSVRLSHLAPQMRRVCCCGLRKQKISIDCARRVCRRRGNRLLIHIHTALSSKCEQCHV